MERRYQVFISSTYTDLVEERQEVIQALLEMDAIPAGMELFPAANADQWSLIQGVIAQCDYYIVIVGGRYGSTTAEGISYTEMEYDFAVESGLPVMGFVHASPADIPAGKTEMDKAARDKLEAFRTKVMEKMVRQYSTPTELGSVVSRGLMKLIRDNPRDGWVRGNFAMTPETQTEIAELRAQVAELRQSKAESERAAPTISDLAVGDDIYRFKHSVLGHTAEDEDQQSYRRQRYIWSVVFETTWNKILQNIGPRLLNETTQNDLNAAITEYGRALWAERDPEDWPESLQEVTETRPETSTLEDIRVQLWAQGMIEHGSKRRQISDKNTYWVLTQAGQDQLMKLRAIRRPAWEFEQPDVEGPAEDENV